MRPYIMKALPLTIVLFSLISPVNVLKAQTLTANITGLDFTYTGYESTFTMENVQVDGNPFSIESGLIFCIDYTKDSYWANAGYTEGQLISEELTNLQGTKSWNSFGNSQDQNLAAAQLGWLIDNFYDDHIINDVDMVSSSAFANVVWEIMHDGGTTESLNFANGNFTRTFSGALQIEMQGMLDAVISSGVDATYVWERPVYVIKDNISTNQDYIFLSTELVPEPSSLAMLSLSGLLALCARRRK